jgi:mRNA interferase MazF
MPLRRGDVYFIDLGPVIGREQAGRRPVVVVSRNRINEQPLVVTVVPGTRAIKIKADYPHNARVPAGEGGLSQETVFLAFQVRAVDHTRFRETCLGQLGQQWMDKVDSALAYCLNFSS